MRLPDKNFLALGLALALAACGGTGGDAVPMSTPVPPQGPAADYPMVIGAPFTVDGVLYTPADTLNFDEVGRAVLDEAGGTAVTGEHRTLPLPSYVEVTSLETGRTILVRLERRGPMTGNSAVGLSPGALAQLSAKPGTPVRVRRVNPPEQERAMLRRGERAPDRMDTPMSLVEVLRRKLPAGSSAPVDVKPEHGTPDAPPLPVTKPSAEKAAQPAAKPAPKPKPKPKPKDVPPAKPATPEQTAPPPAAPAEPKKPAPPPPTQAAKPGKGAYAVQAGAFSVEANAKAVASRIGGRIDKAGKFYLVRTGPFASRQEAEASLAKVKAAGYSGARIYSAD